MASSEKFPLDQRQRWWETTCAFTSVLESEPLPMDKEVFEDLAGTTDLLRSRNKWVRTHHRAGYDRGTSSRIDLNQEVGPHPYAVFCLGSKCACVPSKTTEMVWSPRVRSIVAGTVTPGTVRTCRGRERGVPVKLHQQFRQPNRLCQPYQSRRDDHWLHVSPRVASIPSSKRRVT